VFGISGTGDRGDFDFVSQVRADETHPVMTLIGAILITDFRFFSETTGGKHGNIQ
jgi:hypothetical protein